jgi:hypothetical protein
VTNGLAAAPPNCGCKTGVSTSIKLLWFKKFLISLIIFDLKTNLFFVSSLVIKSKYLLRYFSSTSCNPECLSGSGFNAFVQI